MSDKKLETTVDRVYQGVYQAISKRSLRPGMKLGEAALAELFNVSRTSVRAALKQLEADGLVSSETNKGCWVSLPSDEEIRSLFETRRLIGLPDAETGKWNFSTNGTYWAGKAGIPSIGFGPGEEETAHTKNDSVVLADVVKATEFYALLPGVMK